MLSLRNTKVAITTILVAFSVPAHASGNQAILMIFFLGLIVAQLFLLAMFFILNGRNLREFPAITIFGVLGWIGLLTIPSKFTEEFEMFWGLNAGSSLYYSAAFFLLFFPYISLKIWREIVKALKSGVKS